MVSMASSLCNLLIFCLVLQAMTAAASVAGAEELQQEKDRVKDLPGQPAVEFRHYSGYVKLRPQDEKALFYWFFEAQGGVLEKPLVLWLNGGPGCSSIAYGAAQELGPFLVRSNGTQLVLNDFSWNKVANILFLEAPVGVGFSYTNKSSDLLELGDRITAEDSHAFLVQWFKRFPSLKTHDFYITGESYAGHYVPQLAELIYERNKRSSSKDSYINLKGFMIGNAVINDETDDMGLIEFAWSHAIISDQIYYGIMKNCDFKSDNLTNLCIKYAEGFLEAYSNIDVYSIYTPVCLISSNKTYRKLVTAPRLFTQHDLWHQLPSGYDPCTKDYAEKYFNREDVQKALHANVTKLPYPYTPCRTLKHLLDTCGTFEGELSNIYSTVEPLTESFHSAFPNVIRQWNDSPDTMLPTIQKLLKAGLRIWVYSGDTDGRVPVTSTRYSINKMGLRIQQKWRAWFDSKQVAGWVVTYEGGLTLATVRGAGHQVPILAPAQSLALFSHFLSNATLPSSRA